MVSLQHGFIATHVDALQHVLVYCNMFWCITTCFHCHMFWSIATCLINPCLIHFQIVNLKARGMNFLTIPDSYYDALRERLKLSKVKVTEDMDTVSCYVDNFLNISLLRGRFQDFLILLKTSLNCFYLEYGSWFMFYPRLSLRQIGIILAGLNCIDSAAQQGTLGMIWWCILMWYLQR